MDGVNEIIPGLFMGDAEAAALLDGPADLHVALDTALAREGSRLVRIDFADDPGWDWRRYRTKLNELKEAAIQIAETVQRGQSALVTCHAGQNRSGLVTGLALCALGYGPRQAILLIRKRRSPECLNNPAFERCLMQVGGSMLRGEER